MDALRGRTTTARENNRKAASATEDPRRIQMHRKPVIAMDLSGQKARESVHLQSERQKNGYERSYLLDRAPLRPHDAYIAHPIMVTNSESFVNLANKRVPKALKALDLVGNLSNKSNYTYTDEQVAAIKKALKAKVNEVCRKFEDAGSNANTFKI